MTKINKINVNGNVYDIQDNSSGYVKGTEISDLVNQLVDEKVAEFLKAGFNTETVDELPTENISYKTIYLVPSQKSEEENIYDEYIYTSESVWEKIGSTKTDLSNYYTKEEVDNVVASVGGNDDILILEYNDKSEETLAKIQNAINSHYKRGLHIIVKTNVSYMDNDDKGLLLYHGLHYQSTQFQFVSYTPQPISDKEYYRIVVDGTWENDIFTLTKVTYGKNSTYTVLTTNNTTAYTPTSDYNPANKKYVDDSVANIGNDILILKYNDETEATITKIQQYFNDNIGKTVSIIVNGNERKRAYELSINNSILTGTIVAGTTQIVFQTFAPLTLKNPKYTRFYANVTWNEDNTVLTITDISYHSISANELVISTTNTTSYTPSKDYHPATKKYVDDQVGAINTILATLTTVEEGE